MLGCHLLSEKESRRNDEKKRLNDEEKRKNLDRKRQVRIHISGLTFLFGSCL